jgi:bifunctional non-homologous end joining protein LigD
MAKQTVSGKQESPAQSNGAALPEFIAPQLAVLVDKPPAGDRWVHEIKHDGYRTAARIESGRVQMLTRKGLDWTARFSPIAQTLAELPVRATYIDGEIVVVRPDGVSSFADLQEALSTGQAGRLSYYAFDLLHLDGRDLTRLPLVQRKQALQGLLVSMPKDAPVHYSEHLVGNGPAAFRHACGLGLEGIVSKLAQAPYRSGRGRGGQDWLKVKCIQRQDFVVGGWAPSETTGRDLKSLLVGYYQGRELIFAGRVGTGFTVRVERDLLARLDKLKRSDSPFVAVPREFARGAVWVEPRLVVAVKFVNWTRDHVLRHPSFDGICEGTEPVSVVIERPVQVQDAGS